MRLKGAISSCRACYTAMLIQKWVLIKIWFAFCWSFISRRINWVKSFHFCLVSPDDVVSELIPAGSHRPQNHVHKRRQIRFKHHQFPINRFRQLQVSEARKLLGWQEIDYRPFSILFAIDWMRNAPCQSICSFPVDSQWIHCESWKIRSQLCTVDWFNYSAFDVSQRIWIIWSIGLNCYQFHQSNAFAH